MRNRAILLVFAAAALVASVSALAQTAAPAMGSGPQLHVYPAKGQTPEQQKADVQACNAWAVKDSGYDPAHPPAPPPKAQPAPVTGSGARVGGAVAGAAVGAIGGNDIGNAAAKGAVVGGVVRRNKNRAAAAQQNQQAAAQQQAAQASYAKAQQACLEGRGYTVK